ncbi:hypothetical protein ADIS_0859 [Lunatimonas lonarensis]|uniref:CHAT domain-containing protein n=2 Tax=Lunatimonas lonarensis TaxID=1232681 RepID=R7ZWZ9_9BACT|nr:hypothetical protein ADIS_0859 [Lunatimonas lonarensis]
MVLAWQVTTDWEGELRVLLSSEHSTGKFEELEQFRLRYVEEIGVDGGFYGELCHRLATYFGQSGMFNRSLELFKEALEGHRRPSAADPSMIVNSYFNLAFFHMQHGLGSDFLVFADSCIRNSQRFDRKRSIGVHIYEQLAAYHYDAGDYQESQNNANKGILLAQKEDLYLGLLYIQVAQAKLAQEEEHGKSDRLDAAHRSLQHAKRILRKNPELAALITSVEANYYLAEKNFQAAQLNYEKAIQLYLSRNEYEGAVRNLIKLGDLFMESLKDPLSSFQTYQEGLRILDRVHRMDLRPILLNKIALLYMKDGDFLSAIANLNEAIEGLKIADTQRNSHRPPSDSNVLYSNDLLAEDFFSNLGRAYAGKFTQSLDSSDLRTSLRHFKTALAAMDRVRWSHAYDQSKLYWRKQAKATFTYALDVCFQLNDVESAFFFLEKSRAVLLQDKLNDSDARKFLSEAENQRERHLKVELALLSSKIAREEEGTHAYDSVYREIFRVRDLQKAFITELESTHPLYVEAKYGSNVMELASLRPVVAAARQSYLAYFNGVSEHNDQAYIYILAVSAGEEKLVKVPMESYQENIQGFLELASDKEKLNRSFDRFQTLSYRLYSKLVEPLGQLEQRLIVSPDDQLVPFDLLVSDPQRAGSYLLLDHAVSYTYSAGFFIRSIRSQRAVKPTLLGFAPVSYQEHLELPALAGADFSLGKFQKFLSGCEFFLHDSATKEQFLTKIYDHPMVVLYTHADAGIGGEEGNLYFHDDKLSVSDLMLVDPLPTELIILSACNTGVGNIRPGEGVFSLARGFAAAGIPTIVTTLWEIDSRATYTLTETFYENVVAGLPLDVALQKAKLSMLHGTDPMHALPYFWGGSIVLGNVQPLEFESQWSATHRFWLAGLLALGFYLLVGYRKKKQLG